MKLLTVQNAKTQKGEAKGYLTGILYMAPHTMATPKSLCPFSTPGCREACLYSAGRGRFTNVQEARIRKARWFVSDQESFMYALHNDIAKLQKRAKREGKKLAIRLNGTSDIRWEQVAVGNAVNIMADYPDVQFYDYTKWPRIHRALLPSNYDLTFSRAETADNQAEAEDWLAHGHRVAAVFATSEGYGIRFTVPGGASYEVVNGDETDLTFLHPGDVILGLKAKGEAKHDTTGFVIRGQ